MRFPFTMTIVFVHSKGNGMRIGILGAGLMGGKLGTIFARAGHEVTFSYARDRAKLETLAHDAGQNARAGTPREAAQHGEALLLAVHWSRVDDALEQAGPLWGKIVITCSLPMNANDTGLVVGHTSSGAEQLATKLAKSSVVSAFGTVPSEVFFAVYEARRRARRPSMAYCGDDDHAKGIAARLIRDVGFDPVDVGTLDVARYLEPFTLLMGKLAYEVEGGPAVAYRFEYFEERS